MNKKLLKVKDVLSKYNQEHLLKFFDSLTEFEKTTLLNQIEKIDFDLILNLYKKSKKVQIVPYEDISPLDHTEKGRMSQEEYDLCYSCGSEIIKSGAFAVVTMAGGQGTRLGYKGPKGTYFLKSDFFEKSLFEIICDDLKYTNKTYNVTLPWFIMTSKENDYVTKDFFQKYNYFNYPKDAITFFTQEQLPLINIDGKLILQEPYLVKLASCGNGNVFKSLKQHGLIEKMKIDGIKWISFGGIDNILLKNADPLFLGLTVLRKL